MVRTASIPEITGYRLSRLSAYGLGVGVIALTTTGLGLLYARTPADVLALLWCAIVAAGAATVGGRFFRAWFDGLHARRERDELLRKTRGAP